MAQEAVLHNERSMPMQWHGLYVDLRHGNATDVPKNLPSLSVKLKKELGQKRKKSPRKREGSFIGARARSVRNARPR